MLKNLAGLLVFAACLTVFASPLHAADVESTMDMDAGAQAETDESYWALGARFAWNNNKKPMMVYNYNGNDPGFELPEYGGPNFGGSLLWGLNKKFALTLSIDLGFFSHKVFPYGSGSSTSATTNFFTVGGLLGTKFYLNTPKPRGVGVYLTAGIGYYFSKAMNTATYTANTDAFVSETTAQYSDPNLDCSTIDRADLYCDGGQKKSQDAFNAGLTNNEYYSSAQTADDQAQEVLDKSTEMVGKLASPLVAHLAIGADFFVSNNFSIGADLIGVRFAFSHADVGEVKAATPDDPFTGEQTMISLYFYSALTMTFNFTDAPQAPAAVSQAPAATPAAAAAAGEQPSSGWGASGSWRTGPATPAGTKTPKAAPSKETTTPGAPVSEPPPAPPTQ